jgi:hypothetical protein
MYVQNCIHLGDTATILVKSGHPISYLTYISFDSLPASDWESTYFDTQIKKFC